jgi:hypothetical protein
MAWSALLGTIQTYLYMCKTSRFNAGIYSLVQNCVVLLRECAARFIAARLYLDMAEKAIERIDALQLSVDFSLIV